MTPPTSHAVAVKEFGICPKCNGEMKFNVYLHATAPASMYASLSKKNMAKRGFRIEAALWETTSWFCVNHKCCFFTRPAAQVRLDMGAPKRKGK